MSIFSSQEQNPKSIEELQKELYNINNEYKGYITKIIASNKSTNINEIINKDISRYSYLKTDVLSNIKDKIVLFKNLIEELKNIIPTKKWKIKFNAYGNRKKPTNTTTKRNYQPNVNNTVQKYIDYLEYLKNILETKLVNDIKIINLFEEVLGSNTEKILQLINEISELNKEKEEKKNEQTKKLITENKQKNLNKKLDKCSIEIKSKLNTLSELSNVQNTELTTYINKVKLDEKLKICSKKIEKNLNSLINTLNNINVPNVSKKGGSNFEITNDIIQKLNLVKLVNVSESEDYTVKLKNIKETYEKGLKENIEQYKKICKALTVYIKDLQQIIKGLLSSFIDEKKEFIKKNKEIFQETTKKINEIINKKIQDNNKRNGTNIKTINISTYNNIHLRNLLEVNILSDIINKNTNNEIKQKLMNYIQLNVILHLIGQTNTNANTKNNRNNEETYHGLTTTEANELIPPITEVLIEHKKNLKDLYKDNITSYNRIPENILIKI